MENTKTNDNAIKVFYAMNKHFKKTIPNRIESAVFNSMNAVQQSLLLSFLPAQKKPTAK